MGRQGFLRRFDLERTFRLMKQTLGRTRPNIRTLEAGDGWTWLRPLGSKNRRPTARYDVGKTIRRPESIIERDSLRG